MPLPTFLIVGAAEAGTTSLYRYLAEHHDVFLSTPKEPRFLSADALTVPYRGPGDDKGDGMMAGSWDAYRALFDNAGDAAAIGEASVKTMVYHEAAIPAVRCRLRAPKIVLVLRDPAERAFSAYRFLVGLRRETLPFRRALAVEEERLAAGWEFVWGYRRCSLYADAVAAFRAAFPEVHVVLFEDLVNDSEASITALHGFLGVEPLRPRSLGEVHNRTALPPRHPRLAAWRRGEGGGGRVLALARSVVPTGVRAGIRGPLDRQTVGARLSLKEMDRRRLIRSLRSDIDRLEALIDRDLSTWKEGTR